MSSRGWTRRRFVTFALASFSALVAKIGSSVEAAPLSRTNRDRAVQTTASGYCPVGEELVFLKLINDYRKANGRSSLKLSRTLGAAAEHHSVDMAKHNYFSHTLYNGTSWSTNITNHGYKASTMMAENIAAGHRRASETFTQWKNSSGHNKNMLNSSYHAIGIGRAYQSDSRYDFYWTTTFGGVFDAGPLC